MAGLLVGLFNVSMNRRYTYRFRLLTELFILMSFHLSAQEGGIVPFASYSANESISFTGNAGFPVSDYYESSSYFVNVGMQSLFSSETDEPDTSLCTIYGLAHTADSLLSYGLIYIIDASDLAYIDSFVVKTGAFTLEHIPVGSFHLLVVPRGSDAVHYLPTYYVNKTTIEESYAIPVREGVWEIGDVDIHLVPVAEKKNSVGSNIDFILFPNPTRGQLYIRLHNTLLERITVTITDLSGIAIYKKDLIPETGLNELTMNIDFLERGMYLITVYTDTFQTTSKIILKL